MELKPAAYVMLGMLRLGARSGYEIRRAAELSLRFFWAVSPRQIYAELRELEDLGLVRGSDDPKGSTKRRMFTLTRSGEQALAGWVSDPEIGSFEWRDLGLLKLFFSDVATVAERRALVTAIRARAIEVQAYFETVVLPVAEATRERHGTDMPGVVAGFGHEFWAWVAEWSERLELELRKVEEST
jgi:DNA-binding PadR family transcriptional regulator